MEIRRYPSDLLSSNMYVITEGNHAIVIDPYRTIVPAEGLTVDRILLTHEHYDHISGVNLWKEQTKARVLCSAACAKNIVNARKNLARLFTVFCELQSWIVLTEKPDADENYKCTADETFEDQTSFAWQGHCFELFSMPGHSQGSIGILLDNQFFFSGDSLMEGREIELRFPGGNKLQWETVGKPRLNAVPNGIRVFPGHFQDFIKKGGN